MADRRDYYFRQKVTEAELDAGFDGLEQADFNLAVDNDVIGVAQGMGVSEKAGTPDLSVDVQGPGVAYSKDGERIAFSSLQNVDMSQDDAAASTAVGSPGNEKIVSLFIKFDRLLSDPRLDGNSLTVFFQRDESFAFSVIQSAEALIGNAIPPAIDPTKILLADVTLINGQTQILNADIDTSRREDVYSFTGRTKEVIAGTAPDALSALLDHLNDHLEDVTPSHGADAIAYAGGAAWADGTTNPATDVEAQLDKIIVDLSTGDGAAKIRSAALSAWNDATVIPAGGLDGVIDQIVTDLAAQTGSGGADKIGAGAQTSGGESVTAGSIFDQVGEILASLDSKPDLAQANNWTANQSIVGADIIMGTGDYAFATARAYTKFVPLAAACSTKTAPAGSDIWTLTSTGYNFNTAVDSAVLLIPINLPDGAIIQDLSLWLNPGVAEATEANRLRFHLWRYTLGTANTYTILGDLGSTAGNTLVEVTIDDGGSPYAAIDNATYGYVVRVLSSVNASTTQDSITAGVTINFTLPAVAF